MNTQIKTQSTYNPIERLSERSNFDINKAVNVIDNGIETHIEEYENKSHKVSHSICPTNQRTEIDIQIVPISKSMGFWTNYDDDKYKAVVRAKSEIFKYL